jgi:hypothetical protein
MEVSNYKFLFVVVPIRLLISPFKLVSFETGGAKTLRTRLHSTQNSSTVAGGLGNTLSEHRYYVTITSQDAYQISIHIGILE